MSQEAFLRRVYLAGDWLLKQLLAAGCDIPRGRGLCRKLGQRATRQMKLGTDPDPNQMAREMLEEYRAGKEGT